MPELKISFSLLLVICASGVSSFYDDLPELGPVSAEVTGRSSVVAPNAAWPYLNDHLHYPSYYPRRDGYGYGGRYGGYGRRYGGYGGRYGGYPGYYPPVMPPCYGDYYPRSQALPNYINFANQLSLARNDPEGPYTGTHFRRAGRKRRSVGRRGYGSYYGRYGSRYGGYVG